MAFWLKSHPYNDMLGNGLPGMKRTWAFDFRVMTPTAWWRVPLWHECRRFTGRRPRAVPHPQDDAATVPVPAPEKYWVLKGLSRQRLRNSLRPIRMRR